MEEVSWSQGSAGQWGTYSQPGEIDERGRVNLGTKMAVRGSFRWGQVTQIFDRVGLIQSV